MLELDFDNKEGEKIANTKVNRSKFHTFCVIALVLLSSKEKYLNSLQLF